MTISEMREGNGPCALYRVVDGSAQRILRVAMAGFHRQCGPWVRDWLVDPGANLPEGYVLRDAGIEYEKLRAQTYPAQTISELLTKQLYCKMSNGRDIGSHRPNRPKSGTRSSMASIPT